MEAAPAPHSAMEQAITISAATDDEENKQQSIVAMATARSRVRRWHKVAVEAAPAHCSTTEQAVTTTAATDDDNIKSNNQAW